MQARQGVLRCPGLGLPSRAPCSGFQGLRAARRSRAARAASASVLDSRRSNGSPPATAPREAIKEKASGQPLTFTTSSTAILTSFTFPSALGGESVALTGSFTQWQNPITLRKVGETGDLARSVVLPPGPIEYKFVIDGVWRHSPRDTMSVVDERINNRKVVSVNSVISWPGSARDEDVYVAGSFLAWAELVPLQRVEGSNVRAVQCCLPYGKHHVRFLVGSQWRLRGDLPQEADEAGELCNVIEVDASESFHLFSNTSWPTATLRARMVSVDSGAALTEWTDTPMQRTQSCLVPWRGCAIPAPRTTNNELQPCKLEFIVIGPNGHEDKPYGGGVYELPGPGGYKLSHGTIRPFPQACKAPIMVVSDVDGTMIEDNGVACAAAAAFRDYWENTAALCASVMVYNTGRSIGQLTGLLEARRDCMTLPDAIVTAVGTKVFLLGRRVPRGEAAAHSWEEDAGWARLLDEGWDLATVRDAAKPLLGDRCHLIDDGSEHPHRIALSVHRDDVNRVVAALKRDTAKAGVSAQYVVSGMGEFLYLDVLAMRAGKRNAMDYVRRLFGVSKDRVAVAGDSGNDILMLEGDTPGIVVGNAQPALISWAVQQKQSGPAATVLTDKALAHGILEGLARHGLY